MSFSGIVGQERAITALTGHIERGGCAGSTLIVGPEGVGRFLLAWRAARVILGDAPLVDAFSHPDLAVLERTDKGIDEVRAAAAALQRKPVQGPRQVLLVRNADRFSLPAHNAMLKMLEEPPGGAAIFLTASDPALLPDTVVSRCRMVRARPLTVAETAAVLEQHGLPTDGAADAEGAPARAIYHAEHGVLEDAGKLVTLLLRRRRDPLADVERVMRRRKDEESKEHRRRLIEIGRVAAGRLRRRLPESENVLRLLVEALGSLAANANPGIVFAELALTPWKKPDPI